MSGHRQAAIALHAVSTADQKLILAELPAADRDTLRGYLRELKELGFDGADAAEVMPPVPSPAPPATTLDRIAAATPATVFAIFQHEPPALTAQFLALHQWPWAAPMLELFTAAQRERIRRARPAVPQLAPARQRFVLDVFGARLESAVERSEPPGRNSPLAPMLRMARSWTR